jgi:hypothetical protein
MEVSFNSESLVIETLELDDGRVPVGVPGGVDEHQPDGVGLGRDGDGDAVVQRVIRPGPLGLAVRRELPGVTGLTDRRAAGPEDPDGEDDGDARTHDHGLSLRFV